MAIRSMQTACDRPIHHGDRIRCAHDTNNLMPGWHLSGDMSVELPFAPVDTIIRRNAGGMRVSAAAAEELAARIQDYGAELAVNAARQTVADGRKTLMAEDFGVETVPSRVELVLPVAPVDRIARLRIDDSLRVGEDARVALASLLEEYADEAAKGAALLARHADRRTVKAEDIQTYFDLST